MHFGFKKSSLHYDWRVFFSKEYLFQVSLLRMLSWQDVMTFPSGRIAVMVIPSAADDVTSCPLDDSCWAAAADDDAAAAVG